MLTLSSSSTYVIQWAVILCCGELWIIFLFCIHKGEVRIFNEVFVLKNTQGQMP